MKTKKAVVFGIAIALLTSTPSMFSQSGGTIGSAVLGIPSNGLIGHWPLNGNANDISGKGHNGTIVGATSIAHGVTGSAYHFDGSSYIDVGDILFPNQTFSVSAWVKSENVDPSSFRAAISKLDDSAGGPFEIYDGFTSVPAYTGPSAAVWKGGVTLVNIEQPHLTLRGGRWHMVTFTYKNGHQTLSVDGAAVVSFNFPGPLPVNTDSVRIGGYEFGPYHHLWTGDIDEVLIYNRALSPVEVLKIYQTIAPPPS